MKTNRKESAVKAAVQAYLDMRTDYFGWRSNSGGAHYGEFFVKFNMPGVADFIGLQAVLPPMASGPVIGRFTAVETKREKGGKQSDDQKRFQANVEAHGGLYVLARSVGEVAEALGPAMVHVVKQRKSRQIPR